jgi:Tn3 transposase DDE domain
VKANTVTDWPWVSEYTVSAAENDPDEQQKRLRYNDLVASAVILQNTVDMMRILRKLDADGHAVSGQDVAYLSP